MFKATAIAKCEIIEPSEKLLQAAKASISELIKSDDIKQSDFIKFAQENKQEDLLYFRAVYATCGFNLNDDVFVKDEFWNARTTPIWKPTNWMHKSNEIVGVIYAVQAQKLDGTPLNIEDNNVPDCDFEIVVNGVIYKYNFPAIASEVKKRSEKGELYVSMESWFNDFSYALLDSAKGTITLVDRNDKTIALDKSLKVYGGAGKYEDKRIGRVLRDITFGGMGIVEKPANPRSAGTTQAEEIKEKMESTMAEASKVEVIVKDLPEYKALADTNSQLTKELSTSKENVERLQKRAEVADTLEKVTEAISKELDNTVAAFKGTPPEPKGSADEIMRAKMSWLAGLGKAFAEATESIETLKNTLTEKDKIIEELNKVKAEWDTEKTRIAQEKAVADKKIQDEKRLNEVKAIFNDDKIVDSLKVNFIDLQEDAYNKWLDEKKVIAGSLVKPVEKLKETKASLTDILNNAKVEAHVEPSEAPKKEVEEIGLAALVSNKKAPKGTK